MVIAPGLVERQARDGWAVLMLVFAAGQLLGSLAAGRATPRRPIFAASVGLLAVGLPPLLLASGAGLASLSAAEILAGVAVSAYGVLVNTAVQRWTTPEHLSKVGSLMSLGSFALLPLGYVLAPSLALIVGPRPLLWAGAIWTLVSVATLIAGRQLREFTGDHPEPEPQPPVPSATGSQ
jgi:MFS family permease